MSTQKHEDMAEDKLILLYLINKADMPLTNMDIVRFVMKSREINYFLIQQFLNELTEKEFISCYLEGSTRLYRITDLGRDVLSYLEKMLLVTVREKINDTIKENINKYKNETIISSDFTPQNDGQYSVNFKITEGMKLLFEINMAAGTKEQAKKLCQSWDAHVHEIYPQIIDIIAKNSGN
jgi:DNA-binding PadR family transcriptional regulator